MSLTDSVDRAVERLAYSPGEAAEALGVSRQHIYNLMNAGQLRSVSFGRSRRIAASELERVLNGGTDAA